MIKAVGTAFNLVASVLATQQPSDTPQNFLIRKQVEYTKNNLIDDILKPIKDEIIALNSDSGYENTINIGIMNIFIDIFNSTTDQNIINLKNEWFRKWEEAFQLNPTINLSKKIYDFIKSKCDSEKWMDNFLKNDYLVDNIFPEISNFMDEEVKNAISNSLFNYDDFSKIINDNKSKILGKFNLNPNDNFPGVNSLENIESRTRNFLEDYFYKLPLVSPDKPYVMIDNKKISLDLNEYIQNEFRKSRLINELATDSLDKAKNEFKTILDIMPDDITADSRFLEVMSSFESETPQIFYKTLFKEKFAKMEEWFKKWNNIISVKQKITKDNSLKEFKINFTFSINSFIVMQKEDDLGLPEIRTDKSVINEETIYSKSMNFVNYLYSTDSLMLKLSPFIKELEDNCVISEDNFLKLLNSLGKKEDDVLENLTLENLKILMPTILKEQTNFNSIIAEIENKLSDNYPKNIRNNLNLKVKFGLQKKVVQGDSFIFLTISINDENIEKLNTLDWSLQNVSVSKKEEIEKLFSKIDKEHIFQKIDLNKIPLKTEIETATQEVFSYFENEIDNQKTVYKNELHDFKSGDKFPKEVLEGIYSKISDRSLKHFLDEFYLEHLMEGIDHKPRFSITFFVESFNKNLILRYEIKDNLTGALKTQNTNGENLDNITINISEFVSPLEKYLMKLREMEPNFQKKFDSEEICKSFAKTETLQIDEVKKIFPKFESLKNEANGEDNPVYIEIGKNNSLRWNDEKKCLEQKFIISLNGENGEIYSEFCWKEISKKFSDSSFIKNEVVKMKSLSEETISKIREMKIPKEEEDQIIKDINLKYDYFEAFPGTTDEDVLKNEKIFKNFLLKKIQEAANFKKEEVFGLMKKNFGGDIPPAIENLFNEESEKFEDILKNHPELIEDSNQLDSFLKLVQNLDASKLIHTSKIMKKNTKIGLSILGGVLGFGGLLGVGNSVKIATTNKKIGKSRNKNMKLRSSKKMSILSVLIGLISIIGSISTFIYLFIIQGGI